jgi:hypothetical protein
MNEQAIQRFFESIIQQLPAVASPRIHLAIGPNVCASHYLLLFFAEDEKAI